ncbi:hypothetical protein JVU11DRAFT_1124 [Chiua virens]|nr:hypothetical protein JVU11DRAFT_1124 [Chiua virens]
MPLLLHNWRNIVALWITAVDAADDEALHALLDLLQKVTHDLHMTLLPVYADLLAKLLDFLRRPIATPALTALLATLSGLFRYLLVPSIHLDLLQQMWSSFHAILPNCSSEVRRAAGEVWASVLRRLKISARENAVILMANNLDSVEIPSAWMLIFACKSVSSTLHTTSPSIIRPLIDCYLTSPDPGPLYTLLRRTLTSIIHHCKDADQFSGIADPLITLFSTIVNQPPSNEVEIERLRRILELISVVCGVRQGSRLMSSHLSQLASALPNIRICPPIKTALLHFSASILTAGDMSMATNVGYLFNSEALKVPKFGSSLLGALAELSWGEWKLVALPVLLRSTTDLLTMEPKQTLRLLSSLTHADKLGEVDVVWRRTMDVWLSERLSRWELTPDGVNELRNLLSLSVYAEKTPVLLVGIVQRMLDAPNSEERQQVDLVEWTRTVMRRWSWSHCVLNGLAGLTQSRQDNFSLSGKYLSMMVFLISPLSSDATSFSEIYLHLRTCISSHSRSLRLSALEILSSKLVKSSPGEQDVLKRCLQGEEVSLDAQGVHERVLRIGRIGQVIKDGEPLATDLCIRWLISQLKVNLRPLWSPAAEALSSLAKRFGDSVWVCFFDELQAITRVAEACRLPEWLFENVEQNENPWEDERTWRDGAAHKIRSAMSSWLDQEHDRKCIILDQKSSDRFDLVSFETQLLSTMGQCASLVEKHNRELVPFFLSIAVSDNTVSSLPRYKINAWLTLFSKFTNPKALHSTETLFELHCSLLSHPNRALQTAALNCVFKYESPNLVRHENTLRRFSDDMLWRDELVHLDLSSLDITDRPMFVDITIHLLFGIMLEKKGHTRGGDRRASVLSVLAVCTEDELGLFVDLMLKPMRSSRRPWKDEMFMLSPVPLGVSPKQQVGFLNLLGEVLRQLGPNVVAHWPALLGTALNLTAAVQTRLGGSKQIEVSAASGIDDTQGEEEEDREDTAAEADTNVDEGSVMRTMRSIRQLGFRRLADFFRNPVSFDYSPYLRTSFDAIFSPRITLLDQENTQAPSALLEVLSLWASRPEYVYYLVDYDHRVLRKVLDCLVATNVKPAVLMHVFDIVDRLLAFSSEDDVIVERIVKPHLSVLLQNLTTLVERTKGDQHLSSPLAQRQISVLSQVAHHITDPEQVAVLVGLLSPLLRKPGKVVPEKTKVNLLTVLNNLFSLVPELSDPTSPTFRCVYELLSHLFLTFRSNGARIALTSTFKQLAFVHPTLQALAPLLESLNACSTKCVNEPDFDRRLTTFTTLNEESYAILSTHEWLPALYNALYFIQDPEELAICNNAAFTLRRFIGVVASDTPAAIEAEPVFMRTVFPVLKNALRSKSELVRAEALGVIAHAVLKCERIASLQEMRPLLAGGDDEVSFFTNIHHIQTHRWTRALRRLGKQCNEGYFRGKTLVDVFAPLVEHYVVSTASLDHLLVAEAINTLGRIAKQLPWTAYYSLVQK